MKHGIFLALSFLLLTTVLAAPTQTLPPSIPSVIDQFVLNIFPDASYHHWVVNDAQTETDSEMIIDVNTFTFVAAKGSEKSLTENRFLLLVLDGQIQGAHKIPLGAEVDCGKDTEI